MSIKSKYAGEKHNGEDVLYVRRVVSFWGGIKNAVHSQRCKYMLCH